MTRPVQRYSPLRRALKVVDAGSKRVVLAVLTRLTARRPEGAPDWDGRTQRVLFLRHDRIGDMIVSTAVIRAIAQAHANIELDVLASPLNAAVIQGERLVHAVVVFDRHRVADYWRLWRHLRGARYDIVVDSMVFSQSLTTLLLMLATRAPHRVGVPKAGKPNVYTMAARPAGADAHHVEHLAQLAVPFGVPAEQAARMEIVLTDAERAAAQRQWGSDTGRRALVNVSAGKAFRRWPDDRFAGVAQHLRLRIPTGRVMILHDPADRARADAIAVDAGVVRADTPGVRDALAMVATADFVFTPDTSIVHAASAFHIPTVAMFTVDQATRWRPFDTVGRVVLSPGSTMATQPLADAIAAIDDVVASVWSS